MSLSNFSWVIPNRLAGSACPGVIKDSKESLANDIREYRSYGITTLVSLEKPSGPIKSLCDKEGIFWIHFPIKDFSTPPQNAEFEQFILDLVNRYKSQENICVHCHAGIGRTGLILSCLVGKIFGINGKKAIDTVRKYRNACETESQINFVKEYLIEYEN